MGAWPPSISYRGCQHPAGHPVLAIDYVDTGARSIRVFCRGGLLWSYAPTFLLYLGLGPMSVVTVQADLEPYWKVGLGIGPALWRAQFWLGSTLKQSWMHWFWGHYLQHYKYNLVCSACCLLLLATVQMQTTMGCTNLLALDLFIKFAFLMQGHCILVENWAVFLLFPFIIETLH